MLFAVLSKASIDWIRRIVLPAAFLLGFDLTVRAAAPKPIITQFAPGSGSPGTLITISGANFGGVVGVTFNGALADFVVISSTQISAAVPFDGTIGPITVASASGTAISSGSFFVSPRVTDFIPARAPAGTVVTIEGANFSDVSSVLFNGKNATAFGVASLSQIHATVPPDATTGPVSVTAAAGTGISLIDFIVAGAGPFITRFSPSSGPPGTQVIIDGENFGGTTAVKFGDKNAASFAVTALTQIHATVPTGATNGPISVTTSLGTNATTRNFIVTGPGPFILDFSPQSGPPGTVVVVDGGNFVGATAVRFNGTNAAFAVTSPTQMQAAVPANATSGPISVATPSGTGASADIFSVTGTGPVITRFSPSVGQPGTLVIIDGANFTDATAVRFNGTNAFFAITAPTQIHASVPPGATNGPISVTTPDGTGVTANSFVVISSAPLITDFSPSGGPSGTRVVINGANFFGTTNVLFNERSSSDFTVTSETQLQATVPAGATTGPIRVANSSGTGVSSNSFIITPRINSFSPSSGPAGTVVTIGGTNLLNANLVLFNGTRANFTADSQNQIRATVPLGATTGPISVANPAGAASSTSNFTVIAAADLSVSATASLDPVTLGNNLTYNISVTNHGPDTATAVHLTNFFSPSVLFISATLSQGNFSFANGVVVCNLGNLASGTNALVNMVVSPTVAGTLTNRTDVGGNELDPAGTNNTAILVTTALSSAAPQLAIVSSAGTVIISWPASAADFVLEMTGALISPILWQTVTDSPVTIGNKKVLTVNASSGQGFYRLKRP